MINDTNINFISSVYCMPGFITRDILVNARSYLRMKEKYRCDHTGEATHFGIRGACQMMVNFYAFVSTDDLKDNKFFFKNEVGCYVAADLPCRDATLPSAAITKNIRDRDIYKHDLIEWIDQDYLNWTFVDILGWRTIEL